MKTLLSFGLFLLSVALPLSFSAQESAFEKDSLLFVDIMEEGFSAAQMGSVGAM